MNIINQIQHIFPDSGINIYLSATRIKEYVYSVAEKLNDKYESIQEPICLVVVLSGAMPFASDLMMYLKFHHKMLFVTANSYVGTTSSGKVDVDTISPRYVEMLRDSHIIIIEDIVDTGRTVDRLIREFSSIPDYRSIRVATLFDKFNNRCDECKDVKPDFSGHMVRDNPFLIGYGLDYKNLYRNIPYVVSVS